LANADVLPVALFDAAVAAVVDLADFGNAVGSPDYLTQAAAASNDSAFAIAALPADDSAKAAAKVPVTLDGSADGPADESVTVDWLTPGQLNYSSSIIGTEDNILLDGDNGE
jgi:hypothetical protein